MSIKTEIKKLEHYQVHPRSNALKLGALLLVAATLFEVTGLGHDRRDLTKREAVTGTRYSINTGKENETVRMPIKFDDGLRATATAGH